VEDYTGRPLDEVRLELSSLNAGGQALLSIHEPVMYRYSSTQPGIIMEQTPLPGTRISGPTEVSLVVSRGEETAMAEIPPLAGLSAKDAADRLGELDLRFSFAMDSSSGNARPETVSNQEPPAGSGIAPGSVVALTWAPPLTLASDEMAGIYRFTLPNNPYPLPITLEARHSDGSRQVLVETRMQSGEFSFPYRQPKGTILVLSMLNKEINRLTLQ
jgi:beta-lactam-binding protein with PASTA domain